MYVVAFGVFSENLGYYINRYRRKEPFRFVIRFIMEEVWQLGFLEDVGGMT